MSASSTAASSSQAPESGAGGGTTSNATSTVTCPCEAGTWYPPQTDVFSDENGFPHIVSATDEGAAYALGVEHFWRFPITTAYLLRYSSGNLSKVMGQAAVGRDLMVKMWRLEEVSKSKLPAFGPGVAPPNWRLLLCAYTRGLNHGRSLWNNTNGYQYLANNTQPVSLPDAAAVQRMLEDPIEDWMVLAWSYAFQGQFVFQTTNTAMDVEAAAVTTAMGLGAFGTNPGDINPLGFNTPASPGANANCTNPTGASNAWAVNGLGSTSGGPILASDPHLPLEGDCDTFGLPRPIWRPAYFTIHSPAAPADPLNNKPAKPELDWAGWTVPGIFMGGIGCNRKVAYGIVSNITYTNHTLWTHGDLSVAQPLITWGTFTYSPASEAADLVVWDENTATLQGQSHDLWWLDGATKTMPIYLAGVEDQQTVPFEQRIYWTMAHFTQSSITPFEYMYRKATSQTMAELSATMDTQAQSFGGDLAIATDYSATDSDNAMGYWYTGQTLDRGSATPTTGIPDTIQIIEEADTSNDELEPQAIYPMSSRPNAVLPDSTNPHRLWITVNSPPDDVAPNVTGINTANMTALCNNNWYILPQRSVPPYPKAPLPPTPYRHLRMQELGAQVLANTDTATQTDMETWMTDIQHIRAVQLRDYWDHLLSKFGPPPQPDGPNWMPGFLQIDDGTSIRNEIAQWVYANAGLSYALPDTSVPSSINMATAAGYMSIIDGAMSWIPDSGFPGLEAVSAFESQWANATTDAYLPDLMTFRDEVNNWNDAGWFTNLTPLRREIILMTFALGFLNRSLDGQTANNSWLNGYYWAAQVPFDVATPSTWSLPWTSNFQSLVLHLPSDEWGLAGGLPPANQLYWGHIHCLDWGADSWLEDRLNVGPKQYILPVSGAATGIFAQGLRGTRSIGIEQPWNFNDPRFPTVPPTMAPNYPSQTYPGGVFHDSRYFGGSRTLTCMELDDAANPAPASVRICTGIGATEIYSEAMRYKPAKDFADRRFVTLRTDYTNWTATALPANWGHYALP